MKVAVTGGSGFIGTNLIEELLKEGFDVCNFDCNRPKIAERDSIWRQVDICDYEAFSAALLEFDPDYVVHLAARTDLDGKTVEDYAANTVGVENLMRIVKRLPSLRKILITSSKFVTRNGYRIRDQFDYCPHTKYGESKVITEQNVWRNAPDCDWCILRPTSIWGPWFGVPYRNFFDMVLKRRFFHIGKTKCYKTYGYIGNAVYQIKALLFADTAKEENKVYYIGDEPPYEINEWADEIAAELGFRIHRMPKWLIRCAGYFGDFLSLFGVHFPMTSFRYGNMTNDGTNDMSSTRRYAPETPYSRKEGVKATLAWLKEEEK